MISIIAILSAVLAGGYINSQKNARDASRKLSLKSMSDALNAYYADYGVFPDQTTILNLINSQGEFSQNGIIYMKKIKNNNEQTSLSREGISSRSCGTYALKKGEVFLIIF